MGSRIAELHDQLRTSLDTQFGRVMLTAGVAALPRDVQAMVYRKVATFDDFSPDNDLYGEHDFGSFDLAGQKFFFKIDCYDKNVEYGSPDPADPGETTRVLTIMLAEDY